MTKISASALFIFVIVLLSVVNVFAGSQTCRLHGEYAVVGSRSCVYVNGLEDFGDNYSLPSTGGRTREGHYDGWLRLNGDGTGDYTFNLIQYQHISINSGNIPIGFFQGSCDVSYECLSNGLISLTFLNCESTCEAGFALGYESTESDPHVLTLAATRNGEVLVMSNTSPVVESWWRVSTPQDLNKRICSRTLTAIRQSLR